MHLLALASSLELLNQANATDFVLCLKSTCQGRRQRTEGNFFPEEGARLFLVTKCIVTKPQKKHSWFCPHPPSSGSNLSTPKYQVQSHSTPEASSRSHLFGPRCFISSCCAAQPPSHATLAPQKGSLHLTKPDKRSWEAQRRKGDAEAVTEHLRKGNRQQGSKQASSLELGWDRQ